MRFSLSKVLITLSLASSCGILSCAHALDLPENAIDYAQQATALMERKDYNGAALNYKKALRLNQSTAMAASLYNNLGLAYRADGKYTLAIASFQRAIRLQPGFELYYKNLIRTWQMSNTLDVALGMLEEAVGQNPSNAEAWYLLGLAQEKIGHPSLAQEAFQRFLQLEPNSKLADAVSAHLKH